MADMERLFRQVDQLSAEEVKALFTYILEHRIEFLPPLAQTQSAETIKLHIVLDFRATKIITEGGDARWSMAFNPGGLELCEAVMHHLKTEHKFLIGRLAAEMLILNIGKAFAIEQELNYAMGGRNMNTGLPDRREFTSSMIQEPIDQILDIIVTNIITQIRHQVSIASPDTPLDKQIVLRGEYSRLKGLDKRFEMNIRAEAMPEATIVIQ
jgi:hypothetical protein